MVKYNNKVLEVIKEKLLNSEIITDSKGRATFNVPASFDIETTSFRKGDKKLALCYLWQMDINGYCFYGRTLQEYADFISELQIFLEEYEINLIVYVHNLSYEFQFIRKYFEWSDIFARKTYKPFKAQSGYITYKCSYVLSGYSLKLLAKSLTEHKIEKLPDFNYRVIRTPKTHLSRRELRYAENDVKIIEFYIREEIKRNNGNILEIPMTQTSYARKACKEACYDFTKNAGAALAIQRYINTLTVENGNQYKMLKRAYMGGYTHANLLYVGEEVENVHSRDIASSYPTVMTTEMFPASAGVNLGEISLEKAKEYFKTHCCIFDVILTNVKAKKDVYEYYLSRSKNIRDKQQKRTAKVRENSNDIICNGRYIEAEIFAGTITEVDMSIIDMFYTYADIKIFNFTIYERYYLPKPIVLTVLELYKQKTELKDVEGKEAEYNHAKQIINSLYGMTVTDIVPDEITYNGEWKKTKANVEVCLTKYNNKRRRFLYYPWGVYITAYARRNLFMAIHALGKDYIYSDTDSVKYLHEESHKGFFERYNSWIDSKAKRLADYYNIPYEMWSPMDKKGNKHPLGHFEYEGDYDKFKTLGAKRYLTCKDGEYKLTCAGVHKENGVKYLETFENPFSAFSEELVIPSGSSGKMILTYVDDEEIGSLTGVDGQTYDYIIPSCIHMEETKYNLNLEEEFLSLMSQNVLDIDDLV